MWGADDLWIKPLYSTCAGCCGESSRIVKPWLTFTTCGLDNNFTLCHNFLLGVCLQLWRIFSVGLRSDRRTSFYFIALFSISSLKWVECQWEDAAPAAFIHQSVINNSQTGCDDGCLVDSTVRNINDTGRDNNPTPCVFLPFRLATSSWQLLLEIAAKTMKIRPTFCNCGGNYPVKHHCTPPLWLLWLPCINMHYCDIIVTVLIIHLLFIRLLIQSALSVSTTKKASESRAAAAPLSVRHQSSQAAVVFMRLSTTHKSRTRASYEHVPLIFYRKLELKKPKWRCWWRHLVEAGSLMSVWCFLYA